MYPNSGEVWDGRAKRWLVSGHYSLLVTDSLARQLLQMCMLFVTRLTVLLMHEQLAECFGHKGFDVLAKIWQEAGASLIGGCCRTTPSTIRAVSKVLKGGAGH